MNVLARRNQIPTSLFACLVALLLASSSWATVIPLVASEANVDALARHSGGHAFWLPGLFDPTSTAADQANRIYVFDGMPNFLRDDKNTGAEGDDTITFSGSIKGLNDMTRTFNFDVEFERLGPGEPLPAGSPKRELKDEAYSDHAPPGPINPDFWSLWEMTSGMLLGTGDVAGAEIMLSGRGPAFQLGLGASGKNVDTGFSGWLGWSLETQTSQSRKLLSGGQGDINLNLAVRSTNAPIASTPTLMLLGLAGVACIRRARRQARLSKKDDASA